MSFCACARSRRPRGTEQNIRLQRNTCSTRSSQRWTSNLRAATGTAKTRYVHPDHLGSTNVVTDENDGLVETQDYYPFGAPRIQSATSTNEKRKYIAQFTDDNSGLDYLNARYYDAGRGQFVTQDPVFWEIG